MRREGHHGVQLLRRRWVHADDVVRELRVKRCVGGLHQRDGPHADDAVALVGQIPRAAAPAVLEAGRPPNAAVGVARRPHRAHVPAGRVIEEEVVLCRQRYRCLFS